MARVMPSNKEAEMSVLGVTFIDNSLIDSICEEVRADMFFDERNKFLFEAVNELHKNGVPVDAGMVKEELDKKKRLSAVGGIEYISEVIDSVITTANLSYYIEILKENATRRNLINAATEIVTEAYDEEDVTTVLDNAERNILNVVKVRTVKDFVPIHEILRRAQAKLEELAKSKKLITGLETGFYDFDKITTGFQPGELIILAARPGMGKTALALNMATYAATTTDKAVAIFNLEMPAEQLVNRIISAQGGIDAYKLQTGQMQERDWKRYNEAMNQLAETNLFIEDNSGVTVAEIKAKCRRLANMPKGLGLVVIDYLQLVTTGNKRIESRQVEVSEISRSLKTMALELGVPVIALSQLSRSAEKRESNMPMLADLRESGSIEQDADMVLFINRKDYYEAKKDQKEKIVPAELVIAKHRKGSLGTIDLLFELNMSAFRSVANEIKDES
ncbi:MAG: replicative DNA helicase [Bacilli bacterium]|nr:replicative DNA helicase [Bacilli bacterium]